MFDLTSIGNLVTSFSGSILSALGSVIGTVSKLIPGNIDLGLLIIGLVIAWFVSDNIEGRWPKTFAFGLLLFLLFKSVAV